MVDASDGWAVGLYGTIIRWNGVQWIPEFPITTRALLPLSLITTLIAIIAVKTRIRKRIPIR